MRLSIACMHCVIHLLIFFVGRLQIGCCQTLPHFSHQQESSTWWCCLITNQVLGLNHQSLRSELLCVLWLVITSPSSDDIFDYLASKGLKHEEVLNRRAQNEKLSVLKFYCGTRWTWHESFCRPILWYHYSTSASLWFAWAWTLSYVESNFIEKTSPTYAWMVSLCQHMWTVVRGRSIICVGFSHFDEMV